MGALEKSGVESTAWRREGGEWSEVIGVRALRNSRMRVWYVDIREEQYDILGVGT